jgi:protein required for attachment to host cells
MQNALIDNLQMMVKMMSSNSSIQGYVHIGGEQSKKDTSQNVDETESEEKQENHEEKEGSSHRSSSSATKQKQKFHQSLKARMLRVV